MVLISFSSTLGTKCMSYMIRPTLVNLNPVELTYYPFMTSLDKCNGSFDSVND